LTPTDERPARDLRAYARQTTVRLVAGVLIILLLVGDGLIYWFYSRSAALMGLVCIGAGLLPLIFIAIAFWVMDRIVKRANNQ
jgi:hypothetical protein